MAAVFCLNIYKPKSIQKAVILAAPDRMNDITDNYFDMLNGSRRLRKQYEQLIVERFGQQTSYFSSAAMAASLHLPCLIVHDAEDQINKYEEGARIHKTWKGSKMITTNDLGHSLQSPEVYKEINEFIMS